MSGRTEIGAATAVGINNIRAASPTTTALISLGGDCSSNTEDGET